MTHLGNEVFWAPLEVGELVLWRSVTDSHASCPLVFLVRKRESSSSGLWECGNRVSDFQGAVGRVGNLIVAGSHPVRSLERFSTLSTAPSFPQPHDFSVFRFFDSSSDRRQLAPVEERLLGFQQHYESMAKPFAWKFTRRDPADLLHKLKTEPNDSAPPAA